MPDVLAQIPVGVLASMIARTIFAISMEESRFTLNGSLLLLKKDGLSMVATDGHRLAMVEHPVDLAERDEHRFGRCCRARRWARF